MKQWRCTVCGQVFEGDAPPVPCPVCGAPENAFEEVVQAGPARWLCTVCGQVFEGDAPPVPCPVCGAPESAFQRLDAEADAARLDTDDSFLIIGGGLAGLAAAKAIRQRNKTAGITIVGGESHLPYNRPALCDVVADGLSLENLFLEDACYYAENDITLRLGAQAAAVDAAAKTVALAGGESLPYTKLLLATGALPFNPVRSEEGAVPVLSLRYYEDAEKLARTKPGSRVVLVGGGILGLEAAEALRQRNCHVTVVELAERILPLQTDETVSLMLREKLEKLGITLITGASVVSAEAGGVTLADGSTLPADLVLASLGVRSETTLAGQLGLELGRGIVVDEFMRTSVPDIFAAGDCAEFGGKVQAMAGAASGMGATAGAAMAGDTSAPYKPFVPATFFEVPGFSLFSVGAVTGDAPESILYQNEQTGAYRKLLFKGGALSGALYVGGNPGAKAVQALAAGAPPAQAMELLK